MGLQERFDFFFGVELGRKLLNIVDNLSHSLQSRIISACEGQKLVSLTQATFQTMRSDECFDLLWEYIEVRSSVNVSLPTLPRRRKVPRRFEIGESAPDHPTTVQDKYRRIYFEAINLIVASINNRFLQKGFNMLQKLETVVTTVKQTQISDVVKDVLDFYGADLGHPDRLQTQLANCSPQGKVCNLKAPQMGLPSPSTGRRIY